MVVLDVDGTLTDGSINILDDGSQFKKFSAKDGLGIKLLVKKGIEVAIISHSFTGQAIEARAKMLGIRHVYAGQEEKDVILEQWLDELKISYSETVFIGDDLNDLPAMRKTAISVCPSDATHDVKEFVDVITSARGGEGCVREFIDKYMNVSY